MTSLRSYILLPGHDPSSLDIAQHSGADLVVFDFEDMVPKDVKAKARLRVRSWLETEPFDNQAVGVRLNPWMSGQDHVDRAALSGVGLAHVFLPKIESVANLETYRQALSDSNLGSPAVHVIIETPAAVQAIDQIAAARPASLIVGAFDLAKALDVDPDPNTKQILRTRRQTAGTAKRAGIAAFDMPFIHLTDISGFEDHIQQAMHLGFTGCAAMTGDQATRIDTAFGGR